MTTLKKIVTTLALLALTKADATLTTSEQWGFGFLAGFCLSLLGFVAAFLLICLQKCLTERCFKIFVNLLYALACGAIIGDAMIHILPEAFTNQQINPRYVSLIFICAIGFFIILERVFKGLGIAHEHWGEDSHHHHEQSQKKDDVEQVQGIKKEGGQAHQGQGEQKEKNKQKECQGKRQNRQNQIQSSSPFQPSPLPITSEIILDAPLNQKKNGENSTPNSQKNCLQNLKGKGAAGYLNLLSSFVHNFFDGLGIGVGFASGDTQVIIPIVIAIVAHEIPREMGDVGILIKNGFSNVQTILCNGFINFMSLFGVIAGLAMGGISAEAQNYILVFVAGNFIYIGADIWKHLLANERLILNIAEIMMLSLGVGAMFLVLLAEG